MRRAPTKKGCAVPASSLRSRYVALLIDRLTQTRYPSAPMLDRIESAITSRDQGEEYIEKLLDRIDEDTYPSPEMLARVNRLIATVEASER